MMHTSSRGYALALLTLWIGGFCHMGQASLKHRSHQKKEDASLRGFTDSVDSSGHIENKPIVGQSFGSHASEDFRRLKLGQRVLELEHGENKILAVSMGQKVKGRQDKYGDMDCRCVGIDKLEGETKATLRNGSSISYPADLGSRCEAWDARRHPKCPGESWCEQQWCYVDPCKCKSVSPLPKPSIYLPGAKYQGRPVHFSYATCGSTDSYSVEDEKKTAKDIKETCAAQVDSGKWGMDKCRCIGIGPQSGTTNVTIKGKLVAFPADTGATCKTWEKDNHPECRSNQPPSWCSQAWCYVDPCSCKLAEQPKTSSYLPASRYQGKPIYYSYATCGSADSFTAKMSTACVNQKTEAECSVLGKCAWTGNECLGKELVGVCSSDEDSGASSSKFSIALALLLTKIFW